MDLLLLEYANIPYSTASQPFQLLRHMGWFSFYEILWPVLPIFGPLGPKIIWYRDPTSKDSKSYPTRGPQFRRYVYWDTR